MLGVTGRMVEMIGGPNTLPFVRITALSITFCSSRTLPGTNDDDR